MSTPKSKRKYQPLFYDGIELKPSFGDRMGAMASDAIVGGLVKGYDVAAVDRSNMSAAHKIYLDSFGLKKDRSPITREYFSPQEMAAISDLISRKGGKRGYLTYEDQKLLRNEAGIDEKTKISDVVAGKIGPYTSVANSLGQFGYEYDPKSNSYKILDEYDFNYAAKHNNRVVDDDFVGDYVSSNIFDPRGLARVYAGRQMPEGTGRKVDLSVPALKILPQATVNNWTPELENKFQKEISQTPWYQNYVKQYGEQPDLNTKDYNYRAAWQQGVQPELYKYDNTYHWPSTAKGRSLKSVSHPTAWMEDYAQITGGRDPNEAVKLTPEQANTLSGMLQLRYGGLESPEEPVWKKVKNAVERAFRK
jgi:hypothetical protein